MYDVIWPWFNDVLGVMPFPILLLVLWCYSSFLFVFYLVVYFCVHISGVKKVRNFCEDDWFNRKPMLLKSLKKSWGCVFHYTSIFTSLSTYVPATQLSTSGDDADASSKWPSFGVEKNYVRMNRLHQKQILWLNDLICLCYATARNSTQNASPFPCSRLEIGPSPAPLLHTS